MSTSGWLDRKEEDIAFDYTGLGGSELGNLFADGEIDPTDHFPHSSS